MDAPAPTPTESTSEMLDAYIKYLPELLRTTTGQVMPTEQALMSAKEAIAPRQAALETDIYGQYGPKVAQIGSDIARQNALNQAGTDVAVLQGPGKTLASEALAAQRIADPEYYKTREIALQQLQNLVGSLDNPNAGLGGSERAEVERRVAQENQARGNINPTATSTVENAMQFGAAGEARKQQRQAAIGSALNLATGTMPAMQSKVDVFQLTTGRPSINTGESRLSSDVGKDVGSTTTGMGQNMFNTLGGLQTSAMDINAQRRDPLDRFSQVMASMPNVSCCFIFMEAYNGTLPWWVRKCRDMFYTDDMRRGYVWMSRWLVPMMQRSKFVRDVINESMIVPLTNWGGWLHSVADCTSWGHKHVRFWFKLWTILGKTIAK